MLSFCYYFLLYQLCRWLSKMIRCIHILPSLATLTFSNLMSFFAYPTILPSAPGTLHYYTRLSVGCACNSDCSDPKQGSSYKNHNKQIKTKKSNKTKTKSMGWRQRRGDMVGEKYPSENDTGAQQLALGHYVLYQG